MATVTTLRRGDVRQHTSTDGITRTCSPVAERTVLVHRAAPTSQPGSPTMESSGFPVRSNPAEVTRILLERVVSSCRFSDAATAMLGDDAEVAAAMLGDATEVAAVDEGGGAGLTRCRAPSRVTRPGPAASPDETDGEGEGEDEDGAGTGRGATASGSRVSVWRERSISRLCITNEPAPANTATPASPTPSCLRRWLRRSRASDR